ncbi:MAG TPA: DUF4124 domain-containing protein [Myxococcota bacterium]|nr:DUF4124 domain-containing protein [Myxococcota bacterium]
MRTNRVVHSLCVGFLLLGCARLASAQTYIWTDERGVVHAAADPSEVPAQYRQKAVQNAAKGSPGVKIVPDANVPAAPQTHSSDPLEQSNNGGTSLSANPHANPQPADPPAKPKASGKSGPYGLPPADEGFEWHCAADPEGGAPHCEQLEKKNAKRARREQAREKARKELGVGPTDEFDPEVQKQVDKRAAEEFDRTTPTPSTKATARPNVDEDIPTDSSAEQQDED